MRGRRDLSLMVMLLRPRKSIQGRSDESFFFTKKNPAPRGEEEGRINPESRESFT